MRITQAQHRILRPPVVPSYPAWAVTPTAPRRRPGSRARDGIAVPDLEDEGAHGESVADARLTLGKKRGVVACVIRLEPLFTIAKAAGNPECLATNRQTSQLNFTRNGCGADWSVGAKSRRRRSRSWSLRKGHGDDWVFLPVVISNMMQLRWFANHANNENGRMAAPVITRPLMTVAQPSRTTLADLIPLIEQANLSPIQKRDQISAVKTTARLLGATPVEIDTDPIRLRKRLETIAPQAVGLSRGRWNNIRSLVGKALALARPVLPGRQTARLLPEWKALFAPLSRNRAASLLAMARYFSVRNVRPDEVRLAGLETYHQGILNDRLRAKPEQTWDMIVWTWNACRREIAGWPDVEIPRSIRREIYVLPWSDFPASLKADVDAFLVRLSGADLSEDGPSRPARAATLKTREYQLRVGRRRSSTRVSTPSRFVLWPISSTSSASS